MKGFRLTSAIIILLQLLFICGIQAQESLSAAGGDHKGNGGSVSFTVGQVGYLFNSGFSGSSAAEGVQQPYETMVLGIEGNDFISLHAEVFPNPVVDYLKLTINDLSSCNYFYQLIDETGKLHRNDKINNSVTLIEVSELSPAIYILSISNGQNEIKSFKIIKH